MRRTGMWRSTQKFLANFFPTLLLLGYIALLLCRLNQWDGVVALTIIPIWIWAIVGVALSLVSWILTRSAASLIVFFVWLLSGIGFAEETHGMIRQLASGFKRGPAFSEENNFRIANFTAAGSLDAVKALAESDIDLYLIREAPTLEELEDFAGDLFDSDYCISHRGELAIVSRGNLLSEIIPEDIEVLHARIAFDERQIIDVSVVSMPETLPTVQIWKPAVWSELRHRRKQKRRQVRRALGENEITNSNTHRIVAGGFAAPPQDDAFRPMERAGLYDPFFLSGEGWVNTYPEPYPYLRIDSTWVSPGFTSRKVFTMEVPGSEHRAVISDLRFPMTERVESVVNDG
ncbi:MAG: endonuclease/exonuclease/phosphatase family protein [Verrucomicrobiota bacterium]